ncbi:MAG: hypothetical protein R3A52_26750 [Polyangiales bacterium]
MNSVLYACDVGSVRAGTFAWARVEPGALTLTTSTSIDARVARLRDDLSHRASGVALGFEAPLFLPEPEDSAALCRGRKGDGNRSVFAPASTALRLRINHPFGGRAVSGLGCSSC